MIRLRSAPSLAGALTVGGLRVALANDLFHRRVGGSLVLRIDDADIAPPPDDDSAHSAPDTADQLMQDLRWAGVEWDDVRHQADRRELYQRAIERLQRDQLIYPCFESEEELRAKQDFRRRRKQRQIYDRAMLSLTPQQRQAAEANGKRPHWRFKLSGRTLLWHDMIQGERQGDLAAVSDPILVRTDGSATPILASVIDDLDAGITHIIRAEDGTGNTAIQMELFEVLGGAASAIRFGHLPALPDTTQGSRRFANLKLRSLRSDGVEPTAIAACLTGQPPGPLATLADQVRMRDFATTDIGMHDMLAINRAVLETMDYAAVADRLPDGATDAFWRAIRGHVDMLREARGWWEVVTGTIVPPVIDGAHELLTRAADLLPAEPWDHAVWQRWMAALAEVFGGDEAALLAPLRLALTGEDDGPDLADLLPLIGRTRAAGRLLLAA